MNSNFWDQTPTQILNKNHSVLEKKVSGKPHYCIDKLEIVSKERYSDLSTCLKRLKPIKQCDATSAKIIEIHKVKNSDYSDASKKGYLSMLRVVSPSPRLFDLLITDEKSFGVYKPWMIEVCKEITTPSTKEADSLTDFLIENTYKKHSIYTAIYDASNPRNPINYKDEEKYFTALEYAEKKRKNRRDVIGKRTLYLDNRNLNFVLYARTSKTHHKPCVHMEWRIHGYNRLLEIGIFKKNSSYFSTLKNLASLNLANVFEKLYSKHIKHCMINEVAFGKHLLDWSNKKKFTKGDREEIQLSYNAFKKTHGIESTSYFIKYCKERKIDYRNFLIDIVLIKA